MEVMFSKEKFILFSNILLITEIIMIFIIISPLNVVTQFISLLLSFVIAIVYVIYAAVYFFKKKGSLSTGVDREKQEM